MIFEITDVFSSSFSTAPGAFLAQYSQIYETNFYCSRSLGGQRWEGWIVTYSPVLEGLLKITALFLRLMAHGVEFVCQTFEIFRLGNLDAAQQAQVVQLKNSIEVQEKTLSELRSSIINTDESLGKLTTNLTTCLATLKKAPEDRRLVVQQVHNSVPQSEIERLQKELQGPPSLTEEQVKLEMEIAKLEKTRTDLLESMQKAQANLKKALEELTNIENKH